MLFFSPEPERFIPTVWIDVVHFPRGVTGPIEEHTFRGPLDHQIREALRHLRNSVITERITKLPDRAEAMRVFNYPFAALEEALVNAVYHRSYEVREPIEVQVLPDQVLVLSYPGPDRSVSLADLEKDRIVSRRYRNRRIGDFLKELELTEGRSTGIPKMREAMAQNGSAPPRFVTDEDRTHFLVRMAIHPAFLEAHDDLRVALTETEGRILRLLKDGPKAAPEIAAALGYQARTGHFKKAMERLVQLGLVSLTLPDKPRSKKQQRQLTAKGRRVLALLNPSERDSS